MTRFVEQDRHPLHIQRRVALGAVGLILALGTVWLPTDEGTALLLFKGGCTLVLWAFVLTELAVTARRVGQARTAERRAEDTMRMLAEALDVLPQAVAIFDPADRPILVNKRFNELHGSSPVSGAGTPPASPSPSLPIPRINPSAHCPTGAGSGSTGIAPATGTG